MQCSISFSVTLILLLVYATSTVATARDWGSLLKNCNLSAFAPNCDNFWEANICNSDVFKLLLPSAVKYMCCNVLYW